MKGYVFVVFLLVVSAIGLIVQANVTVSITAQDMETNTANAVARGDHILYTFTIDNSGSSLNLYLKDVLPDGLHQQDAKYCVDDGGWLAYPDDSEISLGEVTGKVIVKIQAPVMFFAPSTVTDHADVIAAGQGVVASADLETNILPWVYAGVYKLVSPGETVSLNDASAGDPDADEIVSYFWTDNSGGGSFDDPTRLHPTYTAPTTSGPVTLTLTVTDNDGGKSSDSLILRVDESPVVNAGADKSVDEGKTISLGDATATDPDDHWIEHFSWSDGGAGGQFSDPHILHPTYTAPLVSSCSGKDITLTLTATDCWGAETSDSLILHVNNVNAPPTADAGSDKHVHSGDKVTLIGTGTDPDGKIAAYTWSQIAGPSVPLHGKNTDTLTFTAPSVSSTTMLTFRLTVTDDCGAAASDVVNVAVAPAPAPPPPPSPKPAKLTLEVTPDRPQATIDDHVGYTYTVRNAGEAQLINITVQDDKMGTIALDRTSLAPGESATGHATTTITVSDFPGPFVNTAIATAHTVDGRTVNAQASAQVVLVVLPARITIEITALDARGFPLSPLSPLRVGDTVTYVYRVTNTGKAKLSRISAVDSRLGPIPLGRTELAPWESTTGTITYMITESDLPGPLVNTGTVVAYDPAGNEVTDSKTITLLQVGGAKALTLTKSVNTTTANVGDTLVYTYTITNEGQVTITNLVLTDDHLGQIPLPQTVLLPGGSLTVTATYTVTPDDLPGPLTNSAHVTGQGTLGKVSSSAATASVTISGGVAGGGGAVTNACAGRVIISEVAWAGTPADPHGQWIELENLSNAPIDLTGWRIGWYPKGKDPKDKSVWTWIPLRGVISPSPTHPCTHPRRRPLITFVKQAGNDYTWEVVDMAWWVAGKENGNGRGYYLLEHGSDRTVRDVSADLVYHALLPTTGAVIELVNPTGKVVDTANMGPKSGWSAGNASTKATMERTDPLGPDAPDNWHTNPGILVYGTDAAGNRLVATPGKPNSPDLETLVSLAETEVAPVSARAPIAVSLGKEVATQPWIKMTAVGMAAAGGGGAAPHVTLSSGHGAGGYSLNINPTTLPPGSYFIWVTSNNGKAVLIPLLIR